MTDEELIQRIRASLTAAVAGADPPAGLIAQLRASLARDGRRSRGHRDDLRVRRAARPRRAGARVVPVGLAIGVAVAIAAIAVLTLGHPRPRVTGPAASPSGPPPYVSPNDPAMRYVMPVLHPGAAEQYPACRIGRVVRGHRGGSVLGLLNEVGSPKMPEISHAAPTQLLSILAVLRQPPAPKDKLPPRFPLLRVAQGTARVIYVDYIRLARIQGGTSYYLVPVVSAAGLGISPACAAAETAGLHRELPHIPAPLRARAERVLADLIAQQRYNSQPHQAVWELDVQPGGGSASGSGATAWDITQAGDMSSHGTNGNATVSGVVPDGVATITFRYPGRRHGATSITTRPVNNVFVYRAPRTSPTAFPNAIIWRNGHGKVIKTLSENNN